MSDQQPDIYDLGLAADVEMLKRTPVTRRRLLGLGAAGLSAFLTGCASAAAQSNNRTALPLVSSGTAATATPATTSTASPADCVSEIPAETAGPYPADGSRASNQTLNVLTRSGIVRSDIRTSLGTGATAAGVPLTIELTLVDSNRNCAPLAGYALYLWHCDRAGNYSLYSSGVTDEDYLRGVQVSDSTGLIRFTSIFPGCYAGRWPHAHFEVYPSLAEATGAGNIVHTSQLALPEDVCRAVYATDGYSASLRNLGQITLASDNIFRDGWSSQLATLSGEADCVHRRDRRSARPGSVRLQRLPQAGGGQQPDPGHPHRRVHQHDRSCHDDRAHQRAGNVHRSGRGVHGCTGASGGGRHDKRKQPADLRNRLGRVRGPLPDRRSAARRARDRGRGDGPGRRPDRP